MPRFRLPEYSPEAPSGVAAAPDPSQAGRGGVFPIIVSAELNAAEQAWADALRRRHFPAERNHLAAHCTLFHHLPPSSLAELHGRLADMTRARRPTAVLDRLYSLGKGVAVHVNSPELSAMRDDLADYFAGLLIPQDRVAPRLHITIQNKVTPEMARRTLAELEKDFRPRRTGIAALCVWEYRGGPWSLVRRHAFRG